MKTTRRLCWSIIVLLAVGCSCSDDPAADGGTLDATVRPDGALPDAGVGLDAAAAADAAAPMDGDIVIVEDGGASFICRITRCGGRVTLCGDCEDNDGDGFVDARDPECLGPCDNTEGPELTTGVGGEGAASCNRDCYFDFGNGSGSDGCRWDTLCDPNEPDTVCPYDASELGGMRCPPTQADMCLEVCRPLTPNGCDCFGCCTFDALTGRAPGDGGEYVWLGSGVGEGPSRMGTCTLAEITNTAACRPCEPVADCFNDCGRCELCVGRTTLPADCTPPPDAGPRPDGGADAGLIEYRCDPGVQACGLPGEPDCAPNFYCVTGCCVPTLI